MRPGLRIHRPLGRAAVWVWFAVGVPAAAIAISLAVTPAETLQVAGQSVSVSAAGFNPAFHGPGELNLFGRTIPTTVEFTGPIRPKVQWSEVAHLDQLVDAVQQNEPVGQVLQDGWGRYFLHEVAIAVAFALLLAAASARILHMRLRLSSVGVGIAVVIALLVNGGGVAAAAHGLQQVARETASLDELVGRKPLQIPGASATKSLDTPDVVVIGDSTAAGAGNTVAADAGRADIACRRSPDAYAGALASVNDWRVVNLACTNATIKDGLFGSEHINGVDLPSQLEQLKRYPHVRTIIISVGANEVHWANLMELCLASQACDDAASDAWFQQTLDGFALDYFDLLQELKTSFPASRILINAYYEPLSDTPHCPAAYHVTAQKALNLRARLDAFNRVLEDGARGFGFSVAHPSFAGHELCTDQPFIQGPGDDAPLHPNAAGDLAIALADQKALADAEPHTTPASSQTPRVSGTPGTTTAAP